MHRHTSTEGSAAEGPLQHSLPGELFRSDEVFAQEQTRIFERSWLFACHTFELSQTGSWVCLDVGDESVVVVRSPNGVRAFHNVCRHRGTRLCWQERGQHDKALICPYHSWAFNFEGDLVGAANMDEVPGFNAANYALLPVAVEVCEGLVFVNLSEQPASLQESLPGLATRLKPWSTADLACVERRVYDVEANWKLFFQNYNECYHCPTAHPALNRLTPYLDSSNDLEDGPMLGGPMVLRDEVGSMSMTGATCGPVLPGLDADRQRRVYYYTVFPNLFVSLHPDYVLLHRVDALSREATRITCSWFFDAEAAARDDFAPSPAIDFWHQTNEQDWELCQQAHRGVTSRAYVPGPYAVIESMVAAFDREYLRAMQNDRAVEA